MEDMKWSAAGQYITVGSSVIEDPAIKAIVDPYVVLFNAYNNKEVGKTTVPIDALQAYTQETNGANLQADAAVYELETKNSIPVDFHLSGAMSNRKVAASATPAAPVTLKVSDMFSLMPYENSLVVMEMNGPQIKTVLERAYRNYYYYKYVPNYGGYSYYTTCMIDTDHGNQIVYNDLYPAAYDPTKSYVVSFKYGDREVDFEDADTYYRVSTVNYLAAGSCNFNDSGRTLWPLDQIVADTQFYVRDAVIDYTTAMGTISPSIEGRLSFISDVTAPVITVNAPHAGFYMNSDPLTIDFTVTDDISGVKTVTATLDGKPVADGDVINLNLFIAGSTHAFAIEAMDRAYNKSSYAVSFTIKTSIQSMKTVVTNMYNSKLITSADVYKGLMDKLTAAEKAKDIKTRNNNLGAFINLVKAQSGKAIATDAANVLIADAEWLIQQP